MMIRQAALISATLLGLMILGGCSSSTTTSPPPAGPRTWHLNAGADDSTHALNGLNYYPHAITIDTGDTVVWNVVSGEPHTISLLGAGQSQPPSGSPSNLGPAGGSTYDGSTYTSSGLTTFGKSYTLTFTKSGIYTVYCLIHQPEMQLTITVQAKGASYPQTQAQLDAAGQASSTADLAAASDSIATFPYAAGSLQLAAGIAPGLDKAPPSNSTVLRFLDGPSVDATSVTVPLGGMVTWTNLTTNEVHTVTFGIAGQPFPTLNPFGPPSGGNVYDGSAIVNSGIIPPGGSFSVTFTAVGSFEEHCLFHDDSSNMIGTVDVIPSNGFRANLNAEHLAR